MDVVLTTEGSNLSLPLELEVNCTQADIDSLVEEGLTFFGLSGRPSEWRLCFTDAKGRQAGLVPRNRSKVEEDATVVLTRFEPARPAASTSKSPSAPIPSTSKAKVAVIPPPASKKENKHKSTPSGTLRVTSKQEEQRAQILARNAEFAARQANAASTKKSAPAPTPSKKKNLWEDPKKPTRAALAKSPAQSTRSGKSPKTKKTPSKKRPLDTARAVKSEPKAKRTKRATSSESVQSIPKRRTSEPFQVDSDDDSNSELTDLEVLGVDDEHNEPGPGEMVERAENRDVPTATPTYRHSWSKKTWADEGMKYFSNKRRIDCMKCGAHLTPMNNTANPRAESVLAHWPVCTMALVGGLTPENLAARNAIVEEEEAWPAELERRKQEKNAEHEAIKAAREAERQERLRLNPPKPKEPKVYDPPIQREHRVQGVMANGGHYDIILAWEGRSWSLDAVDNLNNIWDVKGVVESYYANHGVGAGDVHILEGSRVCANDEALDSFDRCDIDRATRLSIFYRTAPVSDGISCTVEYAPDLDDEKPIQLRGVDGAANLLSVWDRLFDFSSELQPTRYRLSLRGSLVFADQPFSALNLKRGHHFVLHRISPCSLTIMFINDRNQGDSFRLTDLSRDITILRLKTILGQRLGVSAMRICLRVRNNSQNSAAYRNLGFAGTPSSSSTTFKDEQEMSKKDRANVFASVSNESELALNVLQ